MSEKTVQSCRKGFSPDCHRDRNGVDDEHGRAYLVGVGQQGRVEEGERRRDVPPTVRVERAGVVAARRLIIGIVVLHKLWSVSRQGIDDAACQGIGAAAVVGRALVIKTLAEFIAAVTRLRSYIVEATVALMRVSTAAAFRARPPQPQMPRIPTRAESTRSFVTRKSTAA